MSAEEITEDLKDDLLQSQATEEISFISSVINEIIYSPLNLLFVAIITILLYKIIKGRFDVPHSSVQRIEPELPKLRRDFTVEELKEFDGTRPDGRICFAVLGNVYDVTKGKRFYGPNGPYSAFGGRDASRCLATFSVTTKAKDDYDDLSDLSAMEMDSVREWEMQIKEKYPFVGRLLKEGEEPNDYDDEEDELTADNKQVEDIGNDDKTDNNINESVTNIAGLRERNKSDKITSE